MTGLFDNPKYIKMTQKLLVWLGKQFDQVNNVIGIQLLNEPKWSWELEQFCESFVSRLWFDCR